MLFAVAEVVFHVIAFCFQGVVVFVFNFPAGTPSLNNGNHIVCGDRMVGHKGVVVQDFAGVLMSDDQLTPIDNEGVLSIAQGDLGGKAIAPYLAMFAVPMALGEYFHATALFEHRHPFIQTGVRVGLADKDEELVIGLSDQLAQGLVGIQIISR